MAPFAKRKADLRANVGTEKLISKFTFNKETEFGAVLCTEAPVHLEYYADDAPFYQWIKRNGNKLVREYGDLITAGVHLWIITKVYSTSRCSIACWSGSQQEISIGLEADILDDMSAKPEGSNVKVRTSGPGWAHYGLTALTPDGRAITCSPGDTSEFVIFLSGIRFIPNQSSGKVVTVEEICVLTVVHRKLHNFSRRRTLDASC